MVKTELWNAAILGKLVITQPVKKSQQSTLKKNDRSGLRDCNYKAKKTVPNSTSLYKIKVYVIKKPQK